MCGYSKFEVNKNKYSLYLGYYGGTIQSESKGNHFLVEQSDDPCKREKALRKEFEGLDKAELIDILDQIVRNAEE